MIGHQLFPTPPEIAKKMVDCIPYQIFHKEGMILEPHGGTGNLLLQIGRRMYPSFKGEYRSDSDSRILKHLLTCEIDPLLLTGLESEGYRVVGSDFLEYNGRPDINAIIGNPPFDDGVDHLLHAWKIIPDGGWIVFLLNSESILNPFSKQRQLLLKMIQDHGSVEHLGSVFKDSENPTDVEVSLIVLTKPDVDDPDWFAGTRFEGKASTLQDNEEPINALVRKDFIQSRVDLYNASVWMFEKEFIPAYMKMQRISGIITKGMKGKGADSTTMLLNSLGAGKVDKWSTHTTKTPSQMIGDYIDNLAEIAWEDLLTTDGLHERMTTNVRKEFDKLRQRQGGVAFTSENIMRLMETLIESSQEMYKSALLAAFDVLTKYHDENREHIEGWKTNARFRVRQKFILPWVVDSYGMTTQGQNRLDDLDKVLCNLFNIKWSRNTSTCTVIRESRKSGEGMKGESMWFKFVCYKKGTGHFTFLDKKVWEVFNHEVAIARKWLAPESSDGNDTGTKFKKKSKD